MRRSPPSVAALTAVVMNLVSSVNEGRWPSGIHEWLLVASRFRVKVHFSRMPARCRGFSEPGHVYVRISPDEEQMLLVLMHELIELILCQNVSGGEMMPELAHRVAGEIERRVDPISVAA